MNSVRRQQIHRSESVTPLIDGLDNKVSVNHCSAKLETTCVASKTTQIG